jgi:putative hydrolase of the HAD superfamily
MDHPNPPNEASAASAVTDRGGRWVFFDGDNTLWHIEALYDYARGQLVDYIRKYGTDADEVESFQRLEDKRLFEEMGYSAMRFATSFENTLRRFIPDATNAQLGRARRLARSVFERPAEIDLDAPGVLSCLRKTHHLALITAGEHWVQERRIAAFRYADMFDIVQIVERKSAPFFRDLGAELGIESQRSWVIGDSLRSDVMPALEAGLNAILIANHNWVEVERAENRPSNLRVVDRLSEVLPIIITPGHEIPAPTHS